MAKTSLQSAVKIGDEEVPTDLDTLFSSLVVMVMRETDVYFSYILKSAKKVLNIVSLMSY